MKEPWVIETACLGMRPFTKHDAEELRSALDNDEFVRAAHEYFGTPEAKEELEESLLEGGGHAPGAVVMKATRELAGFFGIRPVAEEGERRLKALYVNEVKALRARLRLRGHAGCTQVHRTGLRAGERPLRTRFVSRSEKRLPRKPVARGRGAARRIPERHRGNAGGPCEEGLPGKSPRRLSRSRVDREAVPRT